MICLLYTQSRLSTIAIILYTCVWIPYIQIKQAIFKMLLGLIIFCSPSSSNHHDEQEKGHSQESSMFDVNLPAIRFQDLMMSCDDDDDDDEGECKIHGVGGEEACCSICLADFKKEDVVSHLPRCKHVFHLDCIERWIDRNQFTCPLCRSSLLHTCH